VAILALSNTILSMSSDTMLELANSFYSRPKGANIHVCTHAKTLQVEEKNTKYIYTSNRRMVHPLALPTSSMCFTAQHVMFDLLTHMWCSVQGKFKQILGSTFFTTYQLQFERKE
jgi:hypothetical protein